MEILIMMIFLVLIVIYNINTKTNKNPSLNVNEVNEKARSNINRKIIPTQSIEAEFLDDEICDDKNIVNNYYIQNNYSSSSSSSKVEKHTRKIWEKLGYKIKNKESFSSIYYGQELYESSQVYKASTKKYVEYKPKKRKKSRSSELHTYDGWEDLGYQVRKGERKVEGSGKKSLFSRDQVAMI